MNDQDDYYIINGYSMKSMATRINAEFSLMATVGVIIEILFIVLIICLYTNTFYIIGASIFIVFGLTRCLLLILAAAFDPRPWLLSSVESLHPAPLLELRKPNILFRSLGFHRNTSFVRAFCYTRDFRGFYGYWCLFAKFIHQFVFIITVIIVLFFYLIIPHAHESNTIRRLLIIQILYIIYTTYFDHLLIWRILVLRDRASKEIPVISTGDPDFDKMLKAIKF